VLAAGQRTPAQLRITLAVRSTGDASGLIVNIVVSHLQPAMLSPRGIAVQGLAWQEAWALQHLGRGLFPCRLVLAS
jgi:hypothetical protein